MLRSSRRWALSAVFLLISAAFVLADFVTTSNPVHPSGTRAAIDAPGELHIRNIGGSDGAGLCVGTSIQVSGRWHSLPFVEDYQKWLARRPGGSYPEMTERDLKLYAQSKGQPVPPHIQHTGGDIEFLRLAVKTRRMVGITYCGHDNFYGSRTIAHMVDCAHLDGSYGAIIDNNDPGKWRWMSDTQLINRWLGKLDNGANTRVGGGWAFVWLIAPPPPIDTTAADYLPERPIVAPDLTFEDVISPDVPGVIPPPREKGVEGEGAVGQEKEYQNPLLRGVDPDMLKPRMRYWVNGEEVTRTQALDLLKSFSDLTDDSGRPFVSIVSDDPKTAELFKSAAFLKYADKLHVGLFTTDSWVAKTRLKSKVSAQLPAKDGGKTVFKADTITEETIVKAAKAALGVVDPPPAPIVPPMPSPLPPGPIVPVPPSPIVPPQPLPLPAPPVPPDVPPAPSGPKIALWQIAVVLFLAWAIFVRKEKQ